MSSTSPDPIADMLSRIRNAILVNKNEIVLPYSKAKEDIANIIQESGFMDKVSSSGKGLEKVLNIRICEENQNARINTIERISKPGQRSYVKVKEIPSIKQGRGIVILSTSKGVMSGSSAKQQNLGGELICKVY